MGRNRERVSRGGGCRRRAPAAEGSGGDLRCGDGKRAPAAWTAAGHRAGASTPGLRRSGRDVHDWVSGEPKIGGLAAPVNAAGSSVGRPGTPRPRCRDAEAQDGADSREVPCVVRHQGDPRFRARRGDRHIVDEGSRELAAVRAGFTSRGARRSSSPPLQSQPSCRFPRSALREKVRGRAPDRWHRTQSGHPGSRPLDRASPDLRAGFSGERCTCCATRGFGSSLRSRVLRLLCGPLPQPVFTTLTRKGGVPP